MARRDDKIDPQLPYIQVARGSAAPAAQLAPALGLSYQHTRGALLILWESLADRRLLGAALASEQAVVLDEAETRARLSLAFGKEIDPSLLVVTGFLERRQDGRYRVRGMSRALGVEEERLAKRGQPRPEPAATPPKKPRKPKPPTQPALLDVPATPAAASPPRAPSEWQRWHVEFEACRRDQLEHDGSPYEPEEGLSPIFVNAAMKRMRERLPPGDAGDEELQRLFDAFTRDPWSTRNPKFAPYGLNAFVRDFDRLLAAERGEGDEVGA